MTIDPTIQSKGYTVLSLFDGMSCGQIALKKLGIKVFKYFASEIKPHAIRVTKHNFPDTIHIGDGQFPKDIPISSLMWKPQM